jgi:predicted acylesterase/phospholipase RssA
MPDGTSPHEEADVAKGEGEKADNGPIPKDIAYPPRLKEEEYRLTRDRPKWTSPKNIEEVTEVGIALSGGGIRSATFCLGVFQALAKCKLLGQIDYISSVSGGSYFAAFYGRLFSRPDIADRSNPSSALEE